MNDDRAIKITKTLTLKYEKAFSSNSIVEKFRFIGDLLRSVEDSSQSMKNVFCMTNPLVDHKNTTKENAVSEIEKACIIFLKDMAKTGKQMLFKDSPCAEAQAYIGMVYELGVFGVKENHKKAYGYYTIAARQNNALGTFRLAQCFEKGIGKTKNNEKALTFYRCAAKLGLIEALHTFGSILIYGDLGCPRDPASGIFYLKLAANRSTSSYPYPYFDLARCFESDNAIKEIISDDRYAFNLYMKGARLGCYNCQYRVARCYEYGNLQNERDMEKAIYWYKKASQAGQIDAQLALSSLYFTGIDNVLEKDNSKAYIWALKAAVKGHTVAAFTVAEFVEAGIGVKKDKIHALWWYTIASVLGHASANSKIDELQRRVQQETKLGEGENFKSRCRLF
ncbi:TPR repeat-containing protein [Hamiltosporidium tvaerminnensis]|uniref:TPR repeat-containing protein n=2 Tax=Hamiltosporidium TaxID=1176354 RepID=A0A4Q9L4F4_9MICR|nr:hypothetical protein LUQ84_001851 [Hamiltosporidium tvaerminnensis]TBU00388.1 TPR repeat-containing protein [Hamiltosporidium tvaerminnensis]TBU02419.1 TPR repeat-containing protein [Hamiltosporidium magnivora]TBU03583.1 TPR repeat-containing protein [Hamiltosporidium magnivora]TBU21036.1 TPR repeat-containing protein [Hamiltosporidium tvaerminnensis]